MKKLYAPLALNRCLTPIHFFTFSTPFAIKSPGARAKWLVLSLLLLLAQAATVRSQSSANYTFSTNNNGSLGLDMNANALDMTGATSLLAAGTDDTRSSLTNIGFDFWFMGVRATNFSCLENGVIELGGNTVATNTYFISTNTTLRLLAPFANDMRVGTDGVVQTKLFGTAPNRVLVIEYKNIMIRYLGTAAAGTGSWQVRLYESTGVIEYIYGTMGTNSASQTAVNVGFGTNTTANTFVTVNTSHVANTSGTFASFTPTASSTVTHLTSAAEGSRRYYRFTPPSAAVAAPTTLTFTGITLTGMTLNWVDNSTNETNFNIFRSTDGINYTYVGTVNSTTSAATGGAYNYAATGLTSSTNYFWQVVANSEAVPSSPLSGSQSSGACALSGTKTIGATGADYTSIAAAITDINNKGLSGPIVLELQTNYAPEGALTLPLLPCASATNTITIRPSAAVASAFTLTSASTTTTLDINGGQYYIIDGRNGGTGTNKYLTIANTSTATGGSAMRFINEGSNNIVRYTTLTSRFASTASGVVIFSTTTGANGNDNNTIDNCDIDGGAGTTASPSAAAQNGIYSSGSTGSTAVNNSGNTISNCNIFNCFMPAAASNGINLAAGSTDWTISGNSIYQTNNRTTTTASVYTGILISSSGNNFSITGNYIGGSAALASGTTVISGTVTSRYRGISLSVGTTTPTSVQGNTIAGWNVQSSSGAATPPGIFSGIYLTAGNANIGTVTGNTIGAATGTGSIIASSSSTGGTSFGIAVDASSTVSSISNNTIGAFTTLGTTTGISHSFTGIATTAGTTLTVNNNTIGSTSTANSINAINASVNAAAQVVTGISNTSSATISITNNTIANVNNAYVPSSASASSVVRGIIASAGAVTITGNTVRNMATAANATGTTSAASVIGISMTSTTAPATVSQNIIHTIGNTNPTAATSVIGIHYAGPTSGATNEVARNFVHSLTLPSSSATAELRGINFSSGLATVKNNMVRLGIDAVGNALTNNIVITGLQDVGSSANTAMYHNSVYVGGTGVGTGTALTHAFRSDQLTNVRIYQNNIFVNARSNGAGTGKHYAVRVAGTGVNPTGLTLNYNVYQATGTGGVFGFYNADVATIAAWRTATGQDANSFDSDPKFLAPVGTSSTVDLHIDPTITTVVEGNGLAVGAVTDDYDGQTRSTLTPTDIGADAGNFTGVDLTAPTIAYTPLANTCTPGAVTLEATITDASGVPTTGGGLPVLYWKINAGAYTAATGTFVSGNTYSFTFGAGTVANDVVSYYIAAQDNATTPNVAVSPSTGAAGLTANPPAAATPPTTPSSYTIQPTLSGTYNVGTGQTYTTIAAAIAAYNAACLTGPVVFNLTDASYTEAAPLTINDRPTSSAVNTLTIKPTLANTTIAPAAATAAAIFILNGADYVTIDGSISNTVNTVCPAAAASRDLTISNTNTSTSSAVIWLQTATGSNGATNNTIKNCNIAGNSNTTTLFGIGSGGTTIVISSLGTGNNNNSFVNNNLSKTQYGIYTQGASAANKNTGTIINQNLINTASPNNVAAGGIVAGFESGITISGNNIDNLQAPGSTDGIAIGLGNNAITSTTFTGNEVINATVTNNLIGTVRGASTYSAVGIYQATTTNTGITLIANNMIRGVNSNGTSGDFASGIFVGAVVGTVNVFYNTVTMVGTLTGGAYPSFAFSAGSSTTALNIQNNIFTSTGSTGANLNRAMGFNFSTFTNLTSNYNDLVVSGTGAAAVQTVNLTNSGATSYTNVLGAGSWNAASGKDANSVSITPVFVSATDLHLAPANNLGLNDIGTPVSVTTDIDCATRSVTTPDMGADEFTPPSCAGAVGGTASGTTAFCTSGTPTITATGYSTGIGSGYQWISSTNAGDYPAGGTPVAGQTNPATLTTGVVSTTTYYWLRVTCTSGTATDNSTLVTVTINPSAAVITGPSTKCTADPAITLTETGGTGTSWSWAPGGATTQSISASPVATTTYTVTVTSPGACVKTATYVVTVATSPTATATAAPNPLCVNTQLNLTSGATFASGYALSSIAYGPVTDPGGASVITGDDEVSTSQTLPFTFNYFGTNYTTVSVYTNGFIQLGTSSGSSSVYAPSMPLASSPNTVIGGVWSDLNATGAAAIRAYTTGSVGSRIYTVHFSNVPFYTTATGNTTGNTDFYIQLFEGTNAVEVHVGEATGASSTTSNKTLGIENSGGTAAYTPAGRNAANWNVATNAKEAWRFTPNSIVSYAWTGPNSFSAGTQNTNIPSVTANSAGAYTVVVTDAIGCTASSTTASVVVTPNVNAGTVSGTSPLCIGATTTYSSNGDAGGTWSSTNTGVATVNPSTGLVTAVAAGMTDIVYTISTGCGSPVSAMKTLTVDPNANAGTVSGTTPLCTGVTVGFSSNGDAGGTWSSTNTSVATVDPNTGAVTTIEEGTTKIVYTVTSGCNAPVMAMFMLTVDPDVYAGSIEGISPLCIGAMETFSSDGDAGGTWSSTNTGVATVNPATGLVTTVGAGSTNIVYTISTGCASPVSASFSLTVDPTVTAGTVSGTSPLCVGATATYSTTGTSGGTWSSTNTGVATVDANTGLVTAVGGGSTDITYTVNTGCGSPTSAFKTLTVNPLPNVGVISGTLSVCVGQTTALSTNGVAGGVWSSTNNTKATVDGSGLVTGIAAGTTIITYQVTDNNSCSSSTSVVVTVNANPGVFSVTGGGVYCIGGAGLPVGLSGSEIGVNYQLKKDNINVGTPVAGTGSTFNFPVQTAAGNYTVEATGTAPVCTIAMSGSVAISEVSCDCYGSTVASAAAYDDGWQTGDNDNPTGFGAWTLSTANGQNSGVNGHFIGSSLGNNGCDLSGGDGNGDGDINTGGEAWGMYANSGSLAEAVRPFVSNMVIGGSFKIRMDNGCVASGSNQAVGFGLQNASGNNLMEFYFPGGGTEYVLNDGGGITGTGIGFTDEGVEVVITRISATGYTIKITRLLSGTTVTLMRNFSNPAGGQLPKQVRLFNGDAGTGSNADAFFNSLEICIPCTPISAVLSGVETICAGVNTTTVSVAITGGVGPYTLVLFDGSNSTPVNNYTSGANIPVSPAGNSTYTIASITDALGCGASATLSGSANITVTPLPDPGIISGTSTVCTGLTTQLSSNGLAGGTWSSSNTGVATVNPATGLVSGITAGTVTITYSVTANNCSSSTTAMVTVNQTPNAGTISGTLTVCTGLTTQLSSNGLAGGSWSSNNPGTASVNPGTGLVTGVAAGSVTITYTVTANGCSSSTTATVVVNQTPNAGAISGTLTVCTGLTTQLSSNGLAGGSWSSGNTGIATVNPATGLVTGITAGTVSITYSVTANGCNSSTSAMVTVNQTPNAGAISGTLTVCTGLTTQLSSNGLAGGSWSSSNPSAASVNPGTGLVTGVAVGAVTITYTVTANGCNSSTTATVTVNQTPNAGTISGTLSVCSGLTTQLSSNGLAGGSWSSGNTGVATINPTSGLATGVSGGTVTITYTVTASGCSSSTTALLTVNQTPNPGTISGTTTICNGLTSQLSSNGAAGGLWSTSNPGVGSVVGDGTVTANSVGTAIIRYHVSDNGCNSTATVLVTVINSPNPGTISGGPGCIGATTNFTTNGQSGGSWSSSNPAAATINPSTGVLTGVAAGNTTVTYTLTFGSCTASTSTIVGVTACNANFDGRIIWSRDGITGVKDVTVTLSGSQSASTVTPASGNYSLTVSPGSTFTITPTKTLNLLNGVNAQDVWRINQHAATSPLLLTNAYDWIAADVNGNNVITPLDANIIQLTILGNPSAMAQWKSSWRFVPTSYSLSLPPWGFPENVTLTGSAANVNFYGIKVGDVVSIFANPANSTGTPMVLRTPDQVLEAGRTVTVDFSADALADIAALQFALRFDPDQLQLEHITTLDGLPLSADNFGAYEAGSGSLRFLWAAAGQSVNLKRTAPVFRLTFKALESGSRLSEVLGLDAETLAGRVYNSREAEAEVELRFDASTAAGSLQGDAGLQLLQNRPNPFVGQTRIGFVLPGACEAQLRIFDAAGRLVTERTKQYPAGRHDESFELPEAPGLFYYELTTPFGVMTKKMTKVE